MRRALTLALALLAAPAGAHDVDCKGELASARRAYESQRARRLRLADPLARTVRQVIERLGDAEREALARFARGEADASEVDRALWPTILPAIDRFNRAGCRDLGGVVRADPVIEASTALSGGRGIHTGILVACARRPLQQGEARRFLGLRVRHGERGITVALHGFVQEREGVFATAEEASWSGLELEVPLGDRAAERAALDRAVSAFTGTQDDFSWAVPRSCLPRVSLAAP